MRLLPKIIPHDSSNDDQELENKLIRREAEIGGNLFGKVPTGHTRRFFVLDSHSIIWYEAWKDSAGHHEVTTRYEIRPDSVLKSQNGQAYQSLSPEELRHLKQAMQLYSDKVIPDYQKTYSL